jgi:hypothetical protein
MTSDRSAWHADERSLRALVDGSAGPVLAASLEAHLMQCPTCRAQANALAFDEDLETTWSAIRGTVEAPERGVVERLLRRTGLSSDTSRLLAAVPSMRGAWLLGTCGVTVFAGLAAVLAGDLGVGLFLLVAPLAPVAGVAAGFGGDADPAHEIVVTTPYSAGRLLLLRTAAVLATSCPVAMLVGLALPGPVWLAVAWLSPAAAGIALTLALSPLVGLTTSAASVGGVWSVVSVAVIRGGDPLMLIGPFAQFVSLILVAVSLATLFANYQSLDLPRRAS